MLNESQTLTNKSECNITLSLGMMPMADGCISTFNSTHVTVHLGPVQPLQHISTLKMMDTCLLDTSCLPLLILELFYVSCYD